MSRFGRKEDSDRFRRMAESQANLARNLMPVDFVIDEVAIARLQDFYEAWFIADMSDDYSKTVAEHHSIKADMINWLSQKTEIEDSSLLEKLYKDWTV